MNRYLNEINSYLKSVPEEIIQTIKKSKNIAVIGHYEPDGDAIGSQLALNAALNRNGYRSTAINQGPFSSIHTKKLKKYFKKTIDENYDLFLIVDVPDKERIGDFYTKMDFNKAIVIDHHVTNKFFGKINWINEVFVSAAEMVFLLLLKMDIGLDDAGICQHLLNGITADNGYFQHIRREKSFSLLASYMLIQRGADPQESYLTIYGNKSLESRKLLALVLNRIESLENGRLLWTYITEKDRKLFQNAQIESLFVFKEMMSISKADVCIYFKKLKNKVDVSFRSRDKVNVAALAKMFGGGGHKSASGVSLNRKFDEIKQDVIDKTVEFIKTRQKN